MAEGMAVNSTASLDFSDPKSLAGLSEDSTLENYKQTALELCEKNKQPENDNQLIV